MLSSFKQRLLDTQRISLSNMYTLTEANSTTRWYIMLFLCSLCHINLLLQHTPVEQPFSGTTQVSQYQKRKTKQETVSGSGISWAICQSAPCSRQITMPTPHHSVFTGRMPFLPPNQQRQSTEGTNLLLQLTQYTTQTISAPRPPQWDNE